MGVWLFKDVVIQRIVQLYIDCLSLNVFYRNHLQVAVFFWWLYFMNKRTQDVDALVFLKNLTCFGQLVAAKLLQWIEIPSQWPQALA